MRGVRTRYDTVLLPFISIVRCPGRPVISVPDLYLINSRKLKIGIGIGKFSVINSEELQIGKNLGSDPRRGIGIGIGKRN